jgi:hypothetical protein
VIQREAGRDVVGRRSLADIEYQVPSVSELEGNRDIHLPRASPSDDASFTGTRCGGSANALPAGKCDADDHDRHIAP